ncbi:hypothetical protein [Kordiimonas pumila]|uniref:Lipoprotein n=1 Tax=Kordiimonas pumila TaxID=2161677 RepID=A0ABV7D8T6_9PROT|nr:hypothetical protein [Kordiimonas pumila]
MMKKLLLAIVVLNLSACSIFKGKGDTIVFDTVLGPETKAQVKTLPSNLKGDSENARYSSEKKVGHNMADPK